MDLKSTGVVKHGGKWHRPGDVIKKVSEEVAKGLIADGMAELIEATKSDIDEIELLRARAKELDIPKASQLGEVKLRDAIAAKEAEQQQEAAKQLLELRARANEHGIEGADELDAEALTAAIAAKEADKNGGD